MAYLEENGIVHGSLKAENVLICEHDKLKMLHPKLIKLMKSSENDKHGQGRNFIVILVA
jgi:serine/threonine protein kinase